jgi:hypothetical protein
VEANDAFSASGFHLPDEDKKAFVCSRRTDLQLTAAMGRRRCRSKGCFTILDLGA